MYIGGDTHETEEKFVTLQLRICNNCSLLQTSIKQVGTKVMAHPVSSLWGAVSNNTVLYFLSSLCASKAALFSPALTCLQSLPGYRCHAIDILVGYFYRDTQGDV